MPQLSYIAKPSQSQVPHMVETPRPVEEAPIYVNAKQLERILKWRMARQRLEARSGCAPESRRPYLHESRHKHAIRRPREPGGRFLNKDELKRHQERCKNALRTGPKVLEQGPARTQIVDVERTDSLVALPRDVVRNGSQDNEIDKLEARQSSNTHSEPQLYTKGSDHISRAMTSSFYGPQELEDLIAADVCFYENHQ